MGFRLTTHFRPDKIERKQRSNKKIIHFHVTWILLGIIDFFLQNNEEDKEYIDCYSYWLVAW